MLQTRMRIFLLYTGGLLEAVHDVSKNPGSHKADFSRNTAIRESGLLAANRLINRSIGSLKIGYFSHHKLLSYLRNSLVAETRLVFEFHQKKPQHK